MKWPVVILSVLALATIASFAPVADLLQYDRSLMNEPIGWLRLITSQLTHWNANHLLWDGLVLLLLGNACERHDRRRTLIAVLASLVLIPLTVHAFAPTIGQFRGLSGIDCALFGLLLAQRARDPDRAPWALPLVLAGGAAFVLKTAIELQTGNTLFVASDPTFAVVPLAHLSGFAIGLAGGYASCAVVGRVQTIGCG